MRSDKPSLLYVIKRAWCVGISMLWCAFRPQCWGESLAMLVYRQSVVNMCIVNPQIRFEECEILLADLGEQRKWHTQGSNRIPHTLKPNWDWTRIFFDPFFFLGHLAFIIHVGKRPY